MARKRVLAASPSAVMGARSKDVTGGLILQLRFSISAGHGACFERSRLTCRQDDGGS